MENGLYYSKMIHSNVQNDDKNMRKKRLTSSKIKCPYKVNSNLQLSMNNRMKKK